MRTLLLTYPPALYAAGAACLVAALLVMAIRRPAAPARAAPAASGPLALPASNAAARA